MSPTRRSAALPALAAALSAALSAALPAAARAQDRLSVGAGAGFVSGLTNPYAAREIGYQAAVNLEYQTPLRALRLRADLFRADWGSSAVGGLTGSVVLAPGAVRGLRPYALAGGGLYQAGGAGAGYGLGLGTTVALGRRTAFVETSVHNYDAHGYWLGRDQPTDAGTARRYNDRFGSRRVAWVPLSFGVRF